ncbi:MFS transporter, partial [Clostridium perfringens]
MSIIGANEPVIIAAAVISAAGFGICISIGFVMGAETVDYSEWKTGLRPQGILIALIGFMVKLGMAVAGVLSAQILSMGGYVAGAV